MSIPTPNAKKSKIRAAAVGLALVVLSAAAPAAAEGWLSVAIIHPEFEDTARERGIDRQANDCVLRHAVPDAKAAGEPPILHCVEVLTYQPEAFFSPGFVIVGAGPFPGRECLYAYLHGWLYQNDFLTPRLVEVRPGGFYNTGRTTGPRDWIVQPECH